jgi:hypothetical protein
MTETTTTKSLVNYDEIINALSSLKDDLEIAGEICQNETLKKAKANLKEKDIPHLPIKMEEAIVKLKECKTKKAFLEDQADLLERVKNSMNLAFQAQSASKEKTKEETIMPSETTKNKTIALDTDKLAELAEDIRNEIETATKAHFKAGKLLSDALDMFKAAGKPAKDWIEWAGLQCSVKKAQAYNLVKIYNTFGVESEFSNCSMRVLNSLVHLDSKLFGKIEDEAKELAKANKLTTKRVNQLIDTVKPAIASKTSNTNTEDKGKDKTGEAIQSELNKESKEESKEENKQEDKEAKEIAKAKDSELDKLRRENEELKEQLAEMNETLKKLESKANSKPESIVPVLPQFSSDCPATVLGVKLGAGPKEINNHFRKMAKIFNASTCPEGAKALKAAREELLKSKKD